MSAPAGPYLVDPLGQTIPLVPPASLGRAPDGAVVIADRRASRRHAEIVQAGGGLVLRDLGSTNGTRLNGQRLLEAAALRNGDVIEIAGAIFTFHDPDATLETTHFPRLVVDAASGDVWVDRCPVQLSAKQRALLSFLWTRRGQVCAKDEIARGLARVPGRNLRLPDREPGQAPAR